MSGSALTGSANTCAAHMPCSSNVHHAPGHEVLCHASHVLQQRVLLRWPVADGALAAAIKLPQLACRETAQQHHNVSYSHLMIVVKSPRCFVCSRYRRVAKPVWKGSSHSWLAVAVPCNSMQQQALLRRCYKVLWHAELQRVVLVEPCVITHMHTRRRA
jgi:hypothetical protein